MHLKRNVGAVNAPVPIAPAVPSEPMDQLVPATPSTSAPNPAPGKTSPFASASSAASSKLAALEASGANGFKLVTSPTVCILNYYLYVSSKRLQYNYVLLSFRWVHSGEEEQLKGKNYLLAVSR